MMLSLNSYSMKIPMTKHLTKPIRAIHFMVLALLMAVGTQTFASTALNPIENRNYARLCFDTTKDYTNRHREENFNIDKYSYWESKIITVTEQGAKIETSIEIDYSWDVGSNGGWGTSIKKEESYIFTCVFLNAVRGDWTNIPAFFQGGSGLYVEIEAIICSLGAVIKVETCERVQSFCRVTKSTKDDILTKYKYLSEARAHFSDNFDANAIDLENCPQSWRSKKK